MRQTIRRHRNCPEEKNEKTVTTIVVKFFNKNVKKQNKNKTKQKQNKTRHRIKIIDIDIV